MGNQPVALALPTFTQAFTSSDQSYANGDEIVVAHSLGAIPKNYQGFAKCTSTDAGYAVGDIIALGGYGTGNAGFTLMADATNLRANVGTSGIAVVRKDTQATIALTAA